MHHFPVAGQSAMPQEFRNLYALYRNMLDIYCYVLKFCQRFLRCSWFFPCIFLHAIASNLAKKLHSAKKNAKQ